MYSGSERFELG